MTKKKKRLTSAQRKVRREAKAERQRKYTWVFMNGKQVRIKRPQTIDGMDVGGFIAKNADPIWLHQNGLWEYIDEDDDDLCEVKELE